MNDQQHENKERVHTNTVDIEWALKLLKEAESNHFYGRLTLIYEDGVIRRAIEERSLKPACSRK